MQTYDTKPKRRLSGLLATQGLTANQAVTFITDGGDVRYLPLYLNAESGVSLDWFRVIMRLTVLANIAKSLRHAPPDKDEDDLPPLPGPRTGGRRRPGAPQVVLLARQRRPSRGGPADSGIPTEGAGTVRPQCQAWPADATGQPQLALCQG